MKRRYVVLGLSLVLAISLAVPAFGGPNNPVATAAKSAKSIAKNALKKAKAAQTTANQALTAANNAQTTANKAQTTATDALTTATNANNNANTRFKSSTQVFGTASANNNSTPKDASASCAGGDNTVLGGGWVIAGTTPSDVTIVSADGGFYANGWFVEGDGINGATPTWSLQAVAVCGQT